VKQRESLVGVMKDTAPHVLAMTATPIPRSLALVAYGSCNHSVLNELPPGRKPITTKVGGGRAVF
jgi:ATP-dependent DNA helicase RecG